MIFSCRYCRPKKRQNPSCIILCIFAFLPLSFSHERERHYFSSIWHKQLSCLAQKTRWIDELLGNTRKAKTLMVYCQKPLMGFWQYTIESTDFLPNMVSISWRVTENQPGDWSEIETAKYFERCIICGTGDVPLRPVSNSCKSYKRFGACKNALNEANANQLPCTLTTVTCAQW